MTVQQLIERLEAEEDKSREVRIRASCCEHLHIIEADKIRDSDESIDFVSTDEEANALVIESL